MSVALLVVTDGRDDYLARTLGSANEHLHGPVSERWMFDDTGDSAYRARLVERYPMFNHIHAGRRQGFGGAIRAAWQHLAAHSAADWVFHLEQDFLFRRPVVLADLVEVVAERPYLVQMALRRQSWNAEEHAAGGVVQRYPEAFRQRCDDRGHCWLEHRLFFTTNPCLYRRSLCRRGWPDGQHSEGRFSLGLLEQGVDDVPPGEVRCGYWGALDSGEWVEHIGQERVGSGY